MNDNIKLMLRKTYKRWGSPGRKPRYSAWWTRMASECGPMCRVGCGMNQGQGQGQAND